MRRILPLLLAVPLYTSLCAAVFRLTGDTTYLGLGWNLFLAAAPLCFALFAAQQRGGRAGRALAGALWALWLLFLPNSFYMLTDLIYVPAALRSGAYTDSFVQWAALFTVGTGALLGALFGLEALRRAWVCARGTWRTGLCAVGCALVCGLCGVGVYLGRFLRLNSWDVLHPLRIAAKLGQIRVLPALGFCAWTGGCVLGLFAFYLCLVRAVRRPE